MGICTLGVITGNSNSTSTSSNGRQCWSCDGVGNTCSSASDMGSVVNCPATVTSCFKSQTSSSSPTTVRRCGSSSTGTKCLESSIHIQADNQFVPAWVCHCEVDGCNTAIIWSRGNGFAVLIYITVIRAYINILTNVGR